ncbi:MAG: orotidine-5'-phosphate decarboxylase [Tannerellaceae bacterium]|jgi:orotidine-5'-phosphate decarboxylase|nr:orotidine-5'-phosphate decarboxylase [Tannerellaceae bacterium]
MTKQELIENIKLRQSFLCIGLDPDIEKLPCCLKTEPDPVLSFNKAIIRATANYCVAYKPNIAFYESLGSSGMKTFEETVSWLKENYPQHFIIADAKRGDIGNTAEHYARSFFHKMNVDAVTVAPYMGEDSVKPFLSSPGHWVILLALTSNKGSSDFQLLENSLGEKLFETVLRKSKEWGNDGQMMYVVGATQGKMLQDIRRIIPDHFLLVPGVGAQGGSLADVVEYGITPDCGLLVNSSRSIIYASSASDFAEAAGNAARDMQQEMASYLRAKAIIAQAE